MNSIQKHKQLDQFYLLCKDNHPRPVLVTKPKNLHDLIELQFTDEDEKIVTILLTEEEINRRYIHA